MKTLLFFALLITSSFSSLQAQNSFFEKYSDDERFTIVNVKESLLGMLKNLDFEGDEEMQAALDLAKEINLIQILNTSETPEAFFKEAKESIAKENYNSMLTVRTPEGENVDILARDGKDNELNDLLVLVGGDEFVLIRIDGRIDLSRLSELSKLSVLGGAAPAEESDEQPRP